MQPQAWTTFAGVMLAALASAVFLPASTAGPVRSGAQGLLIPVAAPLRAAAAWLHREPEPTVDDDTATRTALLAENQRLRREQARLTAQLRQALVVEAERNRLGRDLRERSTPARVITTEAGTGDLMLFVTPGSDVRAGQPVYHDLNLVGKVREVGPAGARVRAITDRASVVNVSFGTFPTAPDGQTPTFVPRAIPPVAVRGDGAGLVVEQLKAPGGRPPVAVGDWALLEDPRDWGRDLTGVRVGEVTAVRTRPDAPQVVEVELRPAANLRGLLDVSVLTR